MKIENEDFDYLAGRVDDKTFNNLISYFNKKGYDLGNILFISTKAKHIETLINEYNVDINKYDLSKLYLKKELVYINPEVLITLKKYNYENIEIIYDKILSLYIDCIDGQKRNDKFYESPVFLMIKEMVNLVFEDEKGLELFKEKKSPVYFSEFFKEKNIDIYPYFNKYEENPSRIIHSVFSEKMLKLLVDNLGVNEIEKALINAKDKKFSMNSYNVVGLFRLNLIDINVLNNKLISSRRDNGTPLYVEFLEKDLELLKVLNNDNKFILNPEIDLKIMNHIVNERILHFSASNPHYMKEIFSLLPKESLLMKDEKGKTLLHYNANKIQGLNIALKLFLKNNLDLNVVDNEGKTFISDIKKKEFIYFIINDNPLFDINDKKYLLLKRDIINQSENGDSFFEFNVKNILIDLEQKEINKVLENSPQKSKPSSRL